MSAIVNKVILQRLWLEVMNNRNIEIFDEICSPDIDHGAFQGQEPGLVGVHTSIAALLGLSSNLTYTVEDVIAEDERVVSGRTAIGTHAGERLGGQPTGRPVTGAGVTMDWVVDRRIVDNWRDLDTLAFHQQPGILDRVPG